jgi:hypothetical protein
MWEYISTSNSFIPALCGRSLILYTLNGMVKPEMWNIILELWENPHVCH